MHRRMLVVLTLVTFLAVSAVAQSPMLKSVEPANAKAGDELVTQGDNLDNSKVADLFLTDGTNDHKVKMVEQQAALIRFTVPQVKPGRYHLMLLTKGATPVYLEQPVICTVEE